jgi:hypothetical protein
MGYSWQCCSASWTNCVYLKRAVCRDHCYFSVHDHPDHARYPAQLTIFAIQDLRCRAESWLQQIYLGSLSPRQGSYSFLCFFFLLCISAYIVIVTVTITVHAGSQLSSHSRFGLPCDWNDCRNSSMGRRVLLRCCVGIPFCDQHIDAHNIPHFYSPYVQQVHKAGRRCVNDALVGTHKPEHFNNLL